MNRVTAAISAVLLLIFIALAWLAFHFHGSAVKAGEQIEQLQSDNNLQAATIVTQAFQFQRANEISAAANRYGINTDAAMQEKEIEYRTILKNQPTCDLAVPTAIAGRLLDYTHRLRSSAMPGDPRVADATRAGPVATNALTYCQAVLWIDPLLAAIDKANNQLAGIREIEKTRKGQPDATIKR